MIFFWIIRAIPKNVLLSIISEWNLGTMMKFLQYLIDSETYFEDKEENESQKKNEEKQTKWHMAATVATSQSFKKKQRIIYITQNP